MKSGLTVLSKSSGTNSRTSYNTYSPGFSADKHFSLKAAENSTEILSKFCFKSCVQDGLIFTVPTTDFDIFSYAHAYMLAYFLHFLHAVLDFKIVEPFLQTVLNISDILLTNRNRKLTFH